MTTYNEQRIALLRRYEDVCAAIARCERRADEARRKYGRRAKTYGYSVPHGLYTERKHIEDDLAGLEYQKDQIDIARIDA